MRLLHLLDQGGPEDLEGGPPCDIASGGDRSTEFCRKQCTRFTDKFCEGCFGPQERGLPLPLCQEVCN